MLDDTSVFTQAVQNVVKRRNQMKEEAAKAKPVPVGEEVVPVHAAWLRWKEWGRGQREEFIAKKGNAEALRIVKHGLAMEEKGGFGMLQTPRGFGMEE